MHNKKQRQMFLLPIIGLGTFVAVLLVYPRSSSTFDLVDNLLQTINETIAVLLAFPGLTALRNIKHDQGYRRIPAILFLGMCLYIVGQILITLSTDILHQAVFTTWADVFYILTNIVIFYCAMLVPTEKVSHTVRTRIIFDGLMNFLAIFCFLWFFVFSPLIENNALDIWGNIFNSIFILGVSMLMVAVVAMLSQVHTRQWQSAIIWFIIAIFFFLAGVIFNFYPIHTAWIDITWPLGFYAWLVGANKVRTILSMPKQCLVEKGEPTPTKWQTFFPYLLLPLVIALLVYMRSYSLHNIQVAITYIAGLSLIVIIVIRQLVTNFVITEFYERVQTQHKELQVRHDELESLQMIISQQNQELTAANTRLEALATIDPVTNLPNHRASANTLQKEMQRSQRNRQYLSILFIDLDHFKAINDGYGHAVGDSVLREFGMILQMTVRSSDLVGRWGGEEFLIILPETTVHDALMMAERVRQAVDEHNFQVGGGIRLTCSVGVSTNAIHGELSEDLITAADEAMYAAKNLGRNQVIHCDDPRVKLNSKNTSATREDAALQGTIKAFTTLIEQYDPQLGQRIQQIGTLAEQVSLHMGYTIWEAKMLRFAAYLMDIGILAIPAYVPVHTTHISDDQQRLLWTHPSIGAKVIEHIPSLRTLVGIVHSHHEHWDGSGYPDGIHAEHIPLGARILHVVNAYVTYLEESSQQHTSITALESLQQLANQYFDPQVIDILAQIVSLKDQQAA